MPRTSVRMAERHRSAIEDGREGKSGRCVYVYHIHSIYLCVCVCVCRAHLNHPPADQGDILLQEVERDAPERDARYGSTHPHRYASTHPHRYHTHVSAHTCTRPNM